MREKKINGENKIVNYYEFFKDADKKEYKNNINFNQMEE